MQMRRLRPAFADFDVSYVSVSPAYAEDVPGCRYHAVIDVTRRNAGMLAVLVPQFLFILLRERPDVVITTGAAPGLVGICLAKLFFRARTMWIDSLANCERMSSSGDKARFFADVWLTQWPQLARPEGPLYWGAVL